MYALKRNKLRGLSPRANYTDRATVASIRVLVCQNFKAYFRSTETYVILLI
jgi:hypothetical protein